MSKGSSAMIVQAWGWLGDLAWGKPPLWLSSVVMISANHFTIFHRWALLERLSPELSRMDTSLPVMVQELAS